MSNYKAQLVATIPKDTYNMFLQKERTGLGAFWYSPICQLCLCLLLALVVRVVLIIHTHGVIDGDEALVGIQAQHILRGEYPFYFYGIPYFGSLEAYLVALVFAVAGSSVWALRAEPTLLSLVIVWLTWRLGTALADFAHLSLSARRQFMFIATLVAAVFPLYDTVLELRTFGGYVETFVLMQLLLLGTLQLVQRWSMQAGLWELILRWSALGFVVGLGFWVDPLIISAVFVTNLWILGYCLFAIRKYARTKATHAVGLTMVGSGWDVLKRLLLGVVALPAMAIGCFPAIYWGANHHWENVTYMLNLGNGYTSLDPALRALYPTRFALTTGLVNLYTTCVVPRVIGGALPSESRKLLTMLHTFTLIVGICCIGITVALVVLSLVMRRPLLIQLRRLAALPLLFAFSTAFFFCISTAAVSGLGCNRDLAGRYATPLMLVLPFFFATTFVATHFVMQRHWRWAGTRGIIRKRGESDSSLAGTLDRPSRWIGDRAAKVVLFVVFFMYLGAQLATYSLTNPGYTFQSPYCTGAPALNDTLIAYLQQHHIRYVWAPNWLGYPIIFKTGGSLLMVDPQPVMKNIAYFNRFPADVKTVLHADRASFLVIIKHGDKHPQLLQMFDAEHITYSAVFFPSQPESDILLVTPISRTVSPFEPGPYFSIFHCSS